MGFWFNIGMQSSAEVRIAEDGAVTVMEGSPDIGGSRASMALMAAETLGVPYERVKAHVGDTEATGFCNVTGGSRTTFATGMAVIQACEDIIAQCKQRAALTWDLDEEQVDWVDGEAVPKPGVNADVNPLSLADIARGAGRTGGPLLGRASLNAQGAGASFSCNFTDTKVDTETGKVDVLSFTAVQDAGRAIHPSYVEGQMQGGAVQGIGWALNEEYIYDADGVMENAGFLDYRVPVASDMPMIDTQIIEVPNPFHPYGVRGVGETPIVAPLAAVSNAVRDQLGFRIDDLPLSPPRVLEAIDEQGGASSPPSEPSRGGSTPRVSTATRGLVGATLLLAAMFAPSAVDADVAPPHPPEEVRVQGMHPGETLLEFCIREPTNDACNQMSAGCTVGTNCSETTSGGTGSSGNQSESQNPESPGEMSQEPSFHRGNEETTEILTCIRTLAPNHEVMTRISGTDIVFAYGSGAGLVAARTVPASEFPGLKNPQDNMYFIGIDRSQIADGAQVVGSSYYEYFAGALVEELVHVSRYHNDNMSTSNSGKKRITGKSRKKRGNFIARYLASDHRWTRYIYQWMRISLRLA